MRRNILKCSSFLLLGGPLFGKGQDAPIPEEMYRGGLVYGRAPPKYNEQRLKEGNFPVKSGFPVLRNFWYSPRTRKGVLTRMRLKRGRHIGIFLD